MTVSVRKKVNMLGRAGAIALAMTLAACGTGASETDAEAIDEQILGEADNSDPALTAALEDQIMVDTDLAGQSNANSALPNDSMGGAPVPDTFSSMTADQRAAQRAISEGRLLSAPAARQATGDECASGCGAGQSAAQGETTLGELASNQQGGPSGESCSGAGVEYSMAYADRMPVAFQVYPRAEVAEAAGNDAPGCRMRVVSFRTPASMDRMIDWYYTRAMRAGYSSEHLIRHGDHVLGGYRERDEGAYYIIFAERSDGGTDIDIIANNGR